MERRRKINLLLEEFQLKFGRMNKVFDENLTLDLLKVFLKLVNLIMTIDMLPYCTKL